MSQPDDDRSPDPEEKATSAPPGNERTAEVWPATETTPQPMPRVSGAAVGDDKETRRTLDDTTPATPSTPTDWGGTAKLATFSPNDFVANRYRILRFIGQGGMGEVYEAEDVELHERVALKTVRLDVAGAERAIERFKREIQLARNVTHPNVCRIFDLGFHRRAVPQGDITFFTMELLEGETLAAWIRRAGKLTTSQALPIVNQIASGLAAAHKAGIVHRDLKSGNVVLVPSKEGTRAVVTDFGLARRSDTGSGSGDAASLTADFVGTPTYMAPEQVRGGKITGATDIYALGVVMYEVLTGTWPFVGDTPLATAVMRLDEDPVSPRKYVPNLDPKWEVAILRCLKRNPAERFATAEDVLDALSEGAVAAKKRPQRRRQIAIALTAAGLLAVSFLLFVAPKLRQWEKSGYVRLTTAPWAEVTDVEKADGQRLGITGQTPMQLRLPPGRYVIELKNKNTAVKVSVVVEANQVRSTSYSFPDIKTDALVEKVLAQD